MKAYQSYKDSGIVWLGKMPNSWRVKRIKHNTYVKGRIGWQGLNSDEYGDVGAYLVTGTDFDKGRIDWDNCHRISEERYAEDPYIQLQDKDLLITKDGTIGKIALVDKLPDKATLNSGVFVTRPKTDDYITPFMYWVLNSNVFNIFIDYTKTGSTIQHLYQQTFVEFSYPVPSLSEQQAIADFLDRKTAQIDALIEKKQRQIDLLQEQRTALINHAITKGLNPNVRMKDSGVEWLGEIPSHWEVARLRWLTKSVVTGKTPPTIQQEYYEDADVNWFSPGDFNHQMILRESKKKINKLAIDDGQAPIYEKDTVLLVGIGATLGKIGIIDKSGSSNQHINAITYNERIYPYYGAYYLNTIKEIVVSLANFATLPILNQSQTKDLLHLIPPYEEQNIIIKYIQEKEEQIQNLIRLQEKMIKSYQEYRMALISEAVTGKIDVRDDK